MEAKKTAWGVDLLAALLALAMAALMALACAPQAAQAKSYPDVSRGSWYYSYVGYVSDCGMMTGYDSGIFAPEDTVTRGMVATVLYRYATGDKGTGGQVTHFTDVAKGMWYTKAVEWCYQKGIVTGYKNPADGSLTGQFGPNDPVTREQLCTMLYRFADYYGQDPGDGGYYYFPDWGDVSSYAYWAMTWCNGVGIISGDRTWNPARLNPQGYATRAQMAKMLTVLRQEVFGGAVSWGKSVSISGATIALESTYVDYAAPATKPKVTLTYKGDTLVEGTDYTLSYANNTAVGKATVTITGKGHFTGSTTRSFYITDKNRYTYEMYVLGSADLPTYTGRTAIVYFKTDHPQSNLYFSSTGSYSTVVTSYADLSLPSSSTNGLYKVDGGYVALLQYDDAGVQTLSLCEYDSVNYQRQTIKSFTLKVEDYDAAIDAWMDSVLATLAAQPGWSSLDSFGKMSALCSYLLDNFTYRDTQNGSYLTLAKRATPFFVSLRWDSYTSPAMLCLFAQKIGGFDDIHNCYGDYAVGTTNWQRWHYYCKVTKDGVPKYYEACPVSGTSEITSYAMIDFTDTASFVHYDAGALRSMDAVSADVLSDALVDEAASEAESTDEAAQEETAGTEGEQPEASDASEGAEGATDSEGAEGSDGAAEGEGADGADDACGGAAGDEGSDAGTADGESAGGEPAPDQSATGDGGSSNGEPADGATDEGAGQPADGVDDSTGGGEQPAEGAEGAEGVGEAEDAGEPEPIDATDELAIAQLNEADETEGLAAA